MTSDEFTEPEYAGAPSCVDTMKSVLLDGLTAPIENLGPSSKEWEDPFRTSWPYLMLVAES